MGNAHPHLRARVWLPAPGTWPQDGEPDWETFTPLWIDFGTHSGWSGSLTSVSVRSVAPPGAEPGWHTARLPVRVEIFDEQPPAGEPAPTVGPAHAETVLPLSADWILGAGQ